jgi:hypothetical protein
MKTEMGLIREKGTNRRRKGKSDGRIIWLKYIESVKMS